MPSADLELIAARGCWPHILHGLSDHPAATLSTREEVMAAASSGRAGHIVDAYGLPLGLTVHLKAEYPKQLGAVPVKSSGIDSRAGVIFDGLRRRVETAAASRAIERCERQATASYTVGLGARACGLSSPR